MDMLSATSGYKNEPNDYVTIEFGTRYRNGLVICLYSPINRISKIDQAIKNKFGHDVKIKQTTMPPMPIFRDIVDIEVEKHIIPKRLHPKTGNCILVLIPPGGLHSFLKKRIIYKQTTPDTIDEVKLDVYIDTYNIINKWREAGFPLVWNTSTRCKKQQFIQVINANEIQKDKLKL